jgi:hypothetical protein
MIHGLTDKQNNYGQLLGTLWKGTPKLQKTSKSGKEYEGYGDDLGEHFRLQMSDPNLISTFQEYYPFQRVRHEKGDYVLTNKLNIFCFTDNIETTFPANMIAYDASSMILRCDRQTILESRQRIEYNGDVFNQMMRNGKECPLKNAPNGAKCPNGCTPQGDFLFYVSEMALIGYWNPVRLRVKGYYDFASILGALQQLQATFGNIKQTSLPVPHGVIPLQLFRYKQEIKRPVIEGGKRTGKNATGVSWTVGINPHPAFLAALSRQSHQQQPLQVSGQDNLQLESVEDKFIDLCDRCDSEEKLNKLIDWASRKGIDPEQINLAVESITAKIEGLEQCTE